MEGHWVKPREVTQDQCGDGVGGGGNVATIGSGESGQSSRNPSGVVPLTSLSVVLLSPLRPSVPYPADYPEQGGGEWSSEEDIAITGQ